MKYPADHPIFTARLNDDCILVRILENVAKTPSGLRSIGSEDEDNLTYDVGSDDHDRLVYGEVCSAGPGRNSEYTGHRMPMPISVGGGELVLFFRYAGDKIKVDVDNETVTYALIRASDVVGVCSGVVG